MKRFMLLVATALLALTVDTSAQKKPDSAQVAVYVFTVMDPSGFVTEEDVSRRQTVVGLTSRISQTSKTLRIVETREAALVVLEITEVGSREESNSLGALSNSLNSLAGGLTALRPRVPETQTGIYRFATLTAGGGIYATEIKGHVGDINASGLAKALEAWVKLNLDRLMASELDR